MILTFQNEEHKLVNLPYECFYCGYKFKFPSQIEEHYNIIRLSKPFESCEIGYECKFKSFSSRTVSNQKQFNCPACLFNAIDENSLKEHISEVHTKKFPFLCSECKITFKTKNSLARHLLIHASERPYRCQRCNYSCQQKQHLKIHVKAVHSKAQSFNCSKHPIRPKLMNISNFKQNYQKPFLCLRCDFKSKSFYYLMKHMLIHKGNLPFQCSLCEYRCITKYILRNHYINHHTHEKPFRCSHCGMCFKRNTILTRHMLTHTEAKSYECHLCSYTCSRKDNLKSHVTVVHTNFKPFKCTECDFSCKHKSVLKLHVNVHSPERPYACERCNFRFKSQDKLRRHAVLHSMKRRYQCSYCSFESKTKTDLKAHIHSNHITNSSCCPKCTLVCDNLFILERRISNNKVSRLLSYYCNSCNLNFTLKSRIKNIIAHKNDSVVQASLENNFNSRVNGLSEETIKRYDSETFSGCPTNISTGNLTEFTELKVLNSEIKCVQKKCETLSRNNRAKRFSVSHKIDSKMKIIKVSDASKLSESNSLLEEPSLCIVTDGLSTCEEKPWISYVKANYQCDICSFLCAEKDEWKQHVKIHSANELKCSSCKKFFHTKTELKNHLSVQHADYKPFRCEICNQRFKLKSHLKQHSVVHSEEKPYPCTICDYRAKLPETLRKHYVTHTPEKPYQCPTCTYRCKLKEKLKRHLLIHSNYRPFKCQQCEYACKTKELLKKHLIVHTREKSSSVLLA